MKNMLGNNESLRELFQGPITDLLVKLNGEKGEETLVELNKFNRREPCWLKDEKTVLPPATETRPRIEILRETPKPCIHRTADEQVAGMEMMFKSVKWQFTTSGLIVPERRKGFDRLIVPGDTTLTNNRVFDVCGASFRSWRYSDDLDTSVPAEKDERHPKNGIYAIWVHDAVEADEELKNLSAAQIAQRDPKMNTMTLLEVQLLELIHFMETGNHLNVHNWTLCSGSRDSDGDVPRTRWCDDEFRVYWRNSDYRNPCLRARQAVTL